MHKVLLFAGLAAIGNAIFVYGQRSGTVSSNPFLFMAGAVTFCALLFIGASLLFGGNDNLTYLRVNWKAILIAAVGFFITFVGFYLMYSRVGASSYTVYATLSILTTSVVVGLLVFREPFNAYHVAAIFLAILAVVFYGYGQTQIGR